MVNLVECMLPTSLDKTAQKLSTGLDTELGSSTPKMLSLLLLHSVMT